MKNTYDLLLKNSAWTEQGDYCIKFKDQNKKSMENKIIMYLYPKSNIYP